MPSEVERIRYPRNTSSGGGGGSQYDRPGINFVELARVGHEDAISDKWISSESGQVLVEVTVQTGNPGAQVRARVAAGVEYSDLELGEQVLLVKVGGNDTHSVIVGRMNSLPRPLAAAVCGLLTGSPLAPTRGQLADAPAFSFRKGRPGRPLAIETGALADLLIQAGEGGSLHIGAGVVHISGLVHLGASPTTPTVPPTVTFQDVPDGGAGVGVIAGTPMVPHVPLPGGNPTTPPYVGPEKGIVRAGDRYQSNIAVDPPYWTYSIALDTLVEALSTFVVAISTLNPGTIAAAKVVYDLAKIAFDAVPKPADLTSAAMTASLLTADDGLAP